MKKAVSVLCLLALVIGLCACANTKQSRPGVAENEIATYTPLNANKTQLTVSVTGAMDRMPMIEQFERDNPDIQITVVDITGGNTDYAPVYDWLGHGDLPDVMFLSNNNWWLNDEYFEDLSTNPITSRYEIASLNDVVEDGHVYFLPGPGSLTGMLYNKDLFRQYGWEVPKTMDEMIALCAQITKDTGGTVVPWNMNAKYAAVLIAPLEAACYESVLRGADNQTWVNSVESGKATFAGHFEPFFEKAQKLIDAGILTQADFSYSATTRTEEFKAGKIAMINHNVDGIKGTDFEVGCFPFVGENEGEDYLRLSTSYYVGIPKKERSAQVQEAIDRFIDYISTPQAHRLQVGDSMMVSSLKGLTLSDSSENPELSEAITGGRYIPLYTFSGDNGKQVNVMDTIRSLLLEMAQGTLTAADATNKLDTSIKAAPVKREDTVLATVPKSLTILETSEYFADLYREKTGSDIALVLNNVIYRGNVMKFLSGAVTEKMVTVFKPRSNDNGSTLVKAVMTGQQLLDALNHPMGKEGATANCTYAYSGLKCTVAPWQEQGSRMTDVKLADGTAIDPAKEYTVSFWSGTVNEGYITRITDTYEDTFEQLLSAKLTADKTVAAPEDGRTTLVWE